MGINRAGWPRQALGHALLQSLTTDPQETPPALTRPGFKVTLTKKPNSLHISPLWHCVDVRFGRLLEGMWSSILSVNLEGGPIKQK